MSGKGAKGLIMGKGPAAINKDKDKDKKKPISRSSRAGLQTDALFGFQLKSYTLAHLVLMSIGGGCLVFIT
ncbi:hypothetical protein C1H46_024150 [Malus baccata]|uniref:Uncharacterized protein n=1 Tax=Malus baccata TaxID=106549 RepID=A0A540LVL8_MALBA|nr:hypothetical protein C1H46_024150 [Malus baccata]